MTNAYAAVAPTNPLPTTPVFIQSPVPPGTQNIEHLFEPVYAVLLDILLCSQTRVHRISSRMGIIDTDFILTSCMISQCWIDCLPMPRSQLYKWDSPNQRQTTMCCKVYVPVVWTPPAHAVLRYPPRPLNNR